MDLKAETNECRSHMMQPRFRLYLFSPPIFLFFFVVVASVLPLCLYLFFRVVMSVHLFLIHILTEAFKAIELLSSYRPATKTRTTTKKQNAEIFWSLSSNPRNDGKEGERDR